MQWCIIKVQGIILRPVVDYLATYVAGSEPNWSIWTAVPYSITVETLKLMEKASDKRICLQDRKTFCTHPLGTASWPYSWIGHGGICYLIQNTFHIVLNVLHYQHMEMGGSAGQFE